MRKSIGIILMCVILSPTLSIATDVGGTIDSNTVWDLAGSPYTIISTVQVAGGVTLTIEPGVIVNIAGNPPSDGIEVWGFLNAIGSNGSEIIFNDVSIRPGDTAQSAVITIQFADINITRCNVWFMIGTGHGGLILRDSKIINTAGCATSSGISSQNADSFVERNVFSKTLGFALNPRGNTINFTNNAFYEDGGAISLHIEGSSGQVVIENNHFLGTGIAIELDQLCSIPIDASNNYWNTTDTNVIDSMIWDRNDDLNIPVYVEYLPILTGPHSNTPNLPPNSIALADVTNGSVPLTVNFDGSQSSDPEKQPLSYLWDLGDSSATSSDVSPTHIYQSTGQYTASLTVTDDLGESATASLLITAQSADGDGNGGGGGCFIGSTA